MNADSDTPIGSDATELARLIVGMRAAYAKGENVMAYARQAAGARGNSPVATLIAYDLRRDHMLPARARIQRAGSVGVDSGQEF